MRAAALAIGVAMVLLAMGSGTARADDCTPAICAGVSPTCWLAYEQITVRKGPQGIPSEHKCKEMAEDPKDFGGWLGVQGVDTRTLICACAAAYWSLQGVSQGLPDFDD